MNPEIFINQDDVPNLFRVLIKFSNNNPLAHQRRQHLINAGIHDAFLNQLVFESDSSNFAADLLAKFRKFRVSARQPDYHPMVAFLQYLLLAPNLHDLDDQKIIICKKLEAYGGENLKAIKAGSAVGRIESPCDHGVGTGVYVGRNLLLTCRHVFKESVAPHWVRFDFKEENFGLEDIFELDLNFIAASHILDFALVKILGIPDQRAATPIKKILSSGPTTRIRLIHHPRGEPMVISEIGQIVQVGVDYLFHNIPAAEGSSGAPVFDHDWEFIGIHRGDSGRDKPPNTTEAIPISGIWDQIATHLN
jgi:hypothetical protein